MQDLRRYTLQAITQAAESYQSATSRGELNEFEAALELRHFTFRDEEGKAWLLDPRSMQWYLFDGDLWSMAEAPTGSLEGVKQCKWSAEMPVATVYENVEQKQNKIILCLVFSKCKRS